MPHVTLRYLPHEGWCDWQFQNLLEFGHAIAFNQLPVAFDPIVEVVSSYKYIRLQAALWEATTEGGRILGASFNFCMDDPAALALLDGMFSYVQGDAFKPTVEMPLETVIQPVLDGIQFRSLRGNDGNFYEGMSIL